MQRPCVTAQQLLCAVGANSLTETQTDPRTKNFPLAESEGKALQRSHGRSGALELAGNAIDGGRLGREVIAGRPDVGSQALERCSGSHALPVLHSSDEASVRSAAKSAQSLKRSWNRP